MKVVVFRLGSMHFATPVEQIESIERLLPIRAVPQAAEHIVGLANLRGVVIAVIDLRKLTHAACAQPTMDSRLLVHERVGCLVDEVIDVANVEEEELDQLDDKRVWKREGDLAVVFDLGAALDAVLVSTGS